MIIAVIVTYYPETDFISHLEQLLPQVQGVVIVNNGGGLPPLPPKTTLIENKTNLGLAAAQNQGIKAALDMGADWVLLLDDDSCPKMDMIQHMLKAYEINPLKSQIGLIAPRVHDRQVHKTYRVITGGKWWFSTSGNPSPYLNDLYFAIASGSLIKREVFEDIGLMREDFFIDHIDTEFCARMLAHEYKMMSAGHAVLYHALGNSARDGTIIRKNYPPERYYTQFRNMLLVVREYGTKLPAYALLNIGSSIRELFRIVVYEQQKREKLKAIARGIREGITTSLRC